MKKVLFACLAAAALGGGAGAIDQSVLGGRGSDGQSLATVVEGAGSESGRAEIEQWFGIQIKSFLDFGQLLSAKYGELYDLASESQVNSEKSQNELKTVIAGAKEQQVTMQATIDELTRRNSELEVAMRAEIDALMQQKSEIEQMLSSAKEQLAASEAKVSELTEIVGQKTREADDLRQKLDGLRSELDAVRADRSEREAVESDTLSGMPTQAQLSHFKELKGMLARALELSDVSSIKQQVERWSGLLNEYEGDFSGHSGWALPDFRDNTRKALECSDLETLREILYSMLSKFADIIIE